MQGATVRCTIFSHSVTGKDVRMMHQAANPSRWTNDDPKSCHILQSCEQSTSGRRLAASCDPGCCRPPAPDSRGVEGSLSGGRTMSCCCCCVTRASSSVATSTLHGTEHLNLHCGTVASSVRITTHAESLAAVFVSDASASTQCSGSEGCRSKLCAHAPFRKALLCSSPADFEVIQATCYGLFKPVLRSRAAKRKRHNECVY